MKAAAKILEPSAPSIKVAPSRKVAGSLIAQGHEHVHSTSKAAEFSPIVEKSLLSQTIPAFSWELTTFKELAIASSSERNQVLQTIIDSSPSPVRREMHDKINLVFEELATNAIYHSYQSQGKDKYSRRSPANLKENEKVVIHFAWGTGGLYLRVSDKGGTLEFSNIQNAFRRCYLGDKTEKIESKEGGAGLGLYMVFEAVTHLKIEVVGGKSTTVSSWIAEKSRNDEDTFSFNFFGGR